MTFSSTMNHLIETNFICVKLRSFVIYINLKTSNRRPCRHSYLFSCEFSSSFFFYLSRESYNNAMSLRTFHRKKQKIKRKYSKSNKRRKKKTKSKYYIVWLVWFITYQIEIIRHCFVCK